MQLSIDLISNPTIHTDNFAKKKMSEHKQENQPQVEQWPMIPSNAFLYFPEGQEIIFGEGLQEKQWRKIFQGGQTYNTFELQKLQKLEERIEKEAKFIDPFFTNANKLRYLQANKFKTPNTLESLLEYTKWKAADFPKTITPPIEAMLNSGAIYMCGRDNCFRPILVADISKFDPQQVQIIPSALVIMLQYMINNLLIEGQVQNYILIMNLEGFTFSLRSIVSKIMGFTSNSYRGRLFASYLLNMPGILSWGWESFASGFVSENTLRKIKVSKESTNDQMWTHISKKMIQSKFGGSMKDLHGQYWPPRHYLMLEEDPLVQKRLITVKTYKEYFESGKLNGRKVKHQLIYGQKQVKEESQIHIVEEVEPLNVSRKVTIMVESSFLAEIKSLQTFFMKDNFKKICHRK